MKPKSWQIAKKLSLFARVIITFLSTAISTLSVIVVTRHLGTAGRGELTSFLLCTAIPSQLLTIPYFLNMMVNRSQIDRVRLMKRSLYLFDPTIIGSIVIGLGGYCLTTSIRGESVKPILFFMAIFLMLSYYLLSIYREFLLRESNNNVYVLDVLVQLFILFSILILRFNANLTVTTYLICFSLFYLIYCFVMTKIVSQKIGGRITGNFASRSRHKDLITKGASPQNRSFVLAGVGHQLILNKDLLFSLYLCTKNEIGSMSAVGTYWVSLRFLKQVLVIHQSVSDEQPLTKEIVSGKVSPRQVPKHLYLQLLLIGMSTIFAATTIKMIFGPGFSFSYSVIFLGGLAEGALMVVLYFLSTDISLDRQTNLIYLTLGQFFLLLLLHRFGLTVGISTIWASSLFTYLALIGWWRFTNRKEFETKVK